ncbi:lipopolysaccharide biosynthesis protein [Aeromicrobium duanguangcaii]|uniref:Oligosaccharide flippase family protein n=1 Tax=Aeromicrobium duanguangcaii TaxID=2968086 RepID=A0ABY5KJ91_9ACTN|nr:oligosaccharide flippase family protein [Aeromicrobium duanguangcaii]MCD9154521.1 oligosaccharide flippase family protein [Aeromicrobium duanguangcaii]MCL3838269.1 oligosaccharide flippase family protein [Aeromicrobium duanguangcaii]UUI68423.1 oligosaccharide flippase family protein [Aeromicrobium duanguangcaii]
MSRSLLGRRLANPSSVLLLSTLVSYAVAFITGAIQARLLGPVGRGELATAVVPATLIALLATFNTQDYFANRSAVGDDPRRLVRESAGISLVLGAVLVPVYVLAVSVIHDPLSHVWWIFVGYALVLPLTLFTTNTVWIATGRERWATVAWSRMLPGLLLALGLGIAAFLGAGVLGVGATVVVTGTLGPLLALAWARMIPLGRPSLTALGAAWRFGLKAWPASTIWLFSQRIDALLVTVIATKDEVGFYVVAVSIASVLMAVSNAIGLPARNFAAQGNFVAVRKRFAISLVATAAAGCVLSAVIPFLVPVVFGAAFEPVNQIAWILIAAQVPLAGATVLSFALVGSGHPSRPLVAVTLGLATAVGAIFGLYPVLGVEGIAVASLLGAVVTFICLLVEAQRISHVFSLRRSTRNQSAADAAER